MRVVGDQPLVSIITPVRNGAQHLEELIQSVLQQDYPDFEHIVIDDGSTDDGATVAILKRYSHLRWWSRENKGQYATLNEGICAARGNILGIISADDMYVAPSTFSSAVDYLQMHPECGCVYGRTLRIDGKGALLPPDPTLRRPPFPAWFLRYALLIQHCSMFIDKEIVVAKGIWFDPSFRYDGDWDWIIRLSMATRFGYLDRDLSLYREHPNQTRQTVGRKALALEDRRILHRYKANYVLYWFLLFQHRMLKGWWLLHTGGFRGLQVAVKDWLRRRSAHNR